MEQFCSQLQHVDLEIITCAQDVTLKLSLGSGVDSHLGKNEKFPIEDVNICPMNINITFQLHNVSPYCSVNFL
jgi:hypothetical protein